MGAPLLAIDAASPTTSVAVERAGRGPALRSDQAPSSSTLLRQIHECLEEVGLRPQDLEGVVALRGPGSFTGLRVGLATALGLSASLQIPATTLSNLEVMAAAAELESGRIVAVADALRGDWLIQPFAAGPSPLAEAEARLARPEEIGALEPDVVIGFGVTRLRDDTAWAAAALLCEPPPLALSALRLARRLEIWDAAGLTEPIYARPPVPVPGAKQ